MEEPNNDSGRLLGEYGEFYLLMEAEPEVLHEAITTSCNKNQLEQIMKAMEDQINQMELTGPSDIPLFQQYLAVWLIALRARDKQISSDDQDLATELNFAELRIEEY